MTPCPLNDTLPWNPALTINEQELVSLCRRHKIKELSLFGSVLREDFGPESDVVEIEIHPDVDNPMPDREIKEP